VSKAREDLPDPETPVTTVKSVVRNLKINILEVVNPRSVYDDTVSVDIRSDIE